MFRKPTRVSLLSWFPVTPTMYVPKIQHAKSSTCVSFPQCILHYTPNRNIYTHNAVVPGRSIKHPIAMYTYNAFRSIHPIAIYTHNAIRFVFNVLTLVCSAVLIVFLFTQKKWWKTSFTSHISMKSEKRTEVVIRTSDAHVRRCSEQIFPDVSFL
jgi:hypothetical protein